MDKVKIKTLFKNLRGDKFLIFGDQALFAFFNFGSIFLLSKLASISVFGSYVIFLSYINFVFIFSTFFLSAPILVILSKKWKENQGIYIVSILLSNLLLSGILSSVCYFFIRISGEKINPLFVFIAPLLMSTFDIFKKFLFSSYRIHLGHAVSSSLILNICFFVGIFLFRDFLDFDVILYVFVLAFLIANSYLILVLTYHKVFVTKIDQLRITRRKACKNIILQHYDYSKWIIIGGIAFWGYSQGLFILSKTIGINDFGISKVRTIQNILGIVNIFILSVENYYIPYFSNYIKNNSIQNLDTLVKELYSKNYKKLVLLLIAVFVFAIVFYSLLYESKYGSGLFLIAIFSLVQLLLFFIRPISISLKAIEVTYPFFIAHIAAFITMIVLGYFSVSIYGYNGMALSFLMSNLSYSLILIYFYRKKIAHRM